MGSCRATPLVFRQPLWGNILAREGHTVYALCVLLDRTRVGGCGAMGRRAGSLPTALVGRGGWSVGVAIVVDAGAGMIRLRRAIRTPKLFITYYRIGRGEVPSWKRAYMAWRYTRLTFAMSDDLDAIASLVREKS